MWLANAVALALALRLTVARVSRSAFHIQPLEQLFSDYEPASDVKIKVV